MERVGKFHQDCHGPAVPWVHNRNWCVCPAAHPQNPLPPPVSRVFKLVSKFGVIIIHEEYVGTAIFFYPMTFDHEAVTLTLYDAPIQAIMSPAGAWARPAELH